MEASPTDDGPATGQTSPPKVPHLNDEVLRNIIESLPSRYQAPLMRTSKRFYRLTGPLLYRRVKFDLSRPRTIFDGLPIGKFVKPLSTRNTKPPFNRKRQLLKYVETVKMITSGPSVQTLHGKVHVDQLEYDLPRLHTVIGHWLGPQPAIKTKNQYTQIGGLMFGFESRILSDSQKLDWPDLPEQVERIVLFYEPRLYAYPDGEWKSNLRIRKTTGYAGKPKTIILYPLVCAADLSLPTAFQTIVDLCYACLDSEQTTIVGIERFLRSPCQAASRAGSGSYTCSQCTGYQWKTETSSLVPVTKHPYESAETIIELMRAHFVERYALPRGKLDKQAVKEKFELIEFVMKEEFLKRDPRNNEVFYDCLDAELNERGRSMME